MKWLHNIQVLFWGGGLSEDQPTKDIRPALTALEQKNSYIIKNIM